MPKELAVILVVAILYTMFDFFVNVKDLVCR